MSEKVFIGKTAPNFVAKAVMPDNSIEFEFDLKEFSAGKKTVLFFYPLDFTFVCPSEIIAFNNRLQEFHDRNTNVIAISVDSHFSHLAWKNVTPSNGGIGNVQFPMVSDLNKNISESYNLLNGDGVAFRGTYLIDEEFKVRHMLINDLPIGRNVDETLRTIDALNFHQEHGDVCPANWQKGSQGMQATTQGVAQFLATNAEKL